LSENGHQKCEHDPTVDRFRGTKKVKVSVVVLVQTACCAAACFASGAIYFQSQTSDVSGQIELHSQLTEGIMEILKIDAPDYPPELSALFTEEIQSFAAGHLAKFNFISGLILIVSLIGLVAGLIEIGVKLSWSKPPK
jgi:hypothetical protein